MDELDDLMGLGNEDKSVGKGLKGNQEGMMRDTLGFLKKSE